MLLLVAPGCSLIFTRGPQPEVQPPPPCTTVNTAPVADTILAVASAALAVAGVAAATSNSNCSSAKDSFGCGLGNGAGDIAIGVGAGFGLLFAVSAGVGYNRTNACRASLGPEVIQPPTQLTPVPETSLLPYKAPLGCAPTGDAPRVCAVVPSVQSEWEARVAAR